MGRNSVSFAAILVVQMRRRGLTGSRELQAELKMKASELQKLRHRISYDRTDSGHWSKAAVEQDKEKDWDSVGRNSLRGTLYDKYMEKRVVRLRTEQGSKRVAMNGAKLRALRDDLERCRMELQGMVVSPRNAGVVARRRLQNFQSIQLVEEQRGIDIRRRKEDDLLPITGSYKPRKDATLWNASSSSVARPIALPVPWPSNKSTRSNSLRQTSKPESLLEFRTENMKPPPVTCRKPNRSIAKNGVRNRNASKDLQMSRSWQQKSSPSPLGYKNASERKTAKAKVNEQKKESKSFEKSYLTGFESQPLIRKSNRRILIYEPRNDTSSHNLSFNADDLADIGNVSHLAKRFDKEESDQYLCERFSKSVDLDLIHRKTSEEDVVLGHSTVVAKGVKDCVTNRTHDNNYDINVVRLRSSQEDDNSGKFVSTDGDSSGSESQLELLMNSASELHNSTHQKNFKVTGIENLNGMTPKTQERPQAIGNVKSLTADTPAVNCPRSRSQIRISKGSVPFLSFRKRSRGDQSLADPVSTMTCKGDEEEIFTKILVLEEQVWSPCFPAPASLERIKGKGGGRLLKANRSFFSLSSLRCRRDDTNPRQPIPQEQITR